MKNIAATAIATMMMAGVATAAEESRSVEKFDSVSLKGSMDLIVNVGKKQSVKVYADDDMISKLITEVHGDTLVVKLKKGRYHDVGEMKVVVTVPMLEEAQLKGSGDLRVNGAKGKRFSAALKGSGDLTISKVKVDTLELDIMGSGDMEVSGSCKDLDVDVMGSGTLEAEDAKCEEAKVSIMGSGDANIYVSSMISASIMGSGDVHVYGDPKKIKSRVMGSGDVVEKN